MNYAAKGQYSKSRVSKLTGKYKEYSYLVSLQYHGSSQFICGFCLGLLSF